MSSWLQALARTRDRFVGALTDLVKGTRRLDAPTREELESLLLQSDMPLGLVEEALNMLAQPRGSKDDFRVPLRKLLVESFSPHVPFSWDRVSQPSILLCVGINGAGKTTTCAKLAQRLRQEGRSVLLGAGDTYRAAGSDQLRIWADRIGCPVVGGQTGGDAAAVAFDTVASAIARKVDWAILDTAGRMHTKQPLMQELEKVRRAIAKQLPEAPHETWVVLDASMGQNALSQARLFHASVPLTGVIVTKLDGSAKAGFLFSIRRELNLPIRFVGLGESADDLVAFDPHRFVDGLLDLDSPSTPS